MTRTADASATLLTACRTELDGRFAIFSETFELAADARRTDDRPRVAPGVAELLTAAVLTAVLEALSDADDASEVHASARSPHSPGDGSWPSLAVDVVVEGRTLPEARALVASALDASATVRALRGALPFSVDVVEG